VRLSTALRPNLARCDHNERAAPRGHVPPPPPHQQHMHTFAGFHPPPLTSYVCSYGVGMASTSLTTPDSSPGISLGRRSAKAAPDDTPPT
jgi:hypothetical protein